MKTYFTTILLFLVASVFSQAVYSPELSHHMNGEKSTEFTEINIFFNNQESLEELSIHLNDINADFDTRVKEVTALLQRNSEYSISAFLKDLDENEINPNKDIISFETYWGVNMLNMKVKTSVIHSIADFKNVRYIDLNTPRYSIGEQEAPVIVTDKSVDGAEPGLKTINADLLWALGYTGRNILFLSVDTGVMPDHPAIDDNFAGNYFPIEQCWYGVRHNYPADNASSSHGTHTTGTVLGLDRETNDTIGVAFNSMWIATDPVASTPDELFTPADLLSVYQWALNPDGNSETTSDVPKVINNSWGYSYDMAIEFGACEMVEAEILVTLEEAGICCIFSAGNDGPGASTIGFPAMRAFNLVNPMAIGALEPDGEQIASFSSRGPTPCVSESGSLQIKPEVCAPGVSVRSCIGRDDYGSLSGTSMSCPHVSGALLLLSEAFPQVSAYSLKNALYMTAVDLGEMGEDNVFGNGRIDVFAAYEFLAQTYTPVPPVTNQYDIKSEIISPAIDLFCTEDVDFTAQILISNIGTQDVENVIVKMYLNSALVVDSILNTTIVSGSNFVFESDNLIFDLGKNVMHTVVKTEADYVEYDRFNNADIKTFNVIQEDGFPYNTDFSDFNDDLSDSNWLIQNPDNLTGWKNLSWGVNEQYNALGIEFVNYESREWQIDYANTPRISLPDQEDLFLNLTYAYKKRVESVFVDSVIIEISTDCGQTFPYELWRNGGVDMATVEGNSFDEIFVPQTLQDFDTISISLADYRGQDVIIRCISMNDRGSTFYVDYISVTGNQISEIEASLEAPGFSIFPNPAKNYFKLQVSNLDVDIQFAEIYNSSGQLMKEVRISEEQNIISLDDFSSGIYFVRIKNSMLNCKLVIE